MKIKKISHVESSSISIQDKLVFALHEHELKNGTDIKQYEADISTSIANMSIPGLLGAHLIKGFKGARTDKYAVLWIFRNAQAIHDNFGTLDNPRWPSDWLHYEQDILTNYIIGDPDKITFTDYEVI
jgi:hypothetical protein